MSQPDKDVVQVTAEVTPRQQINGDDGTEITGTIVVGRLQSPGEIFITLDKENGITGANTFASNILFDNATASIGTSILELVQGDGAELTYALGEANESEWTSGVSCALKTVSAGPFQMLADVRPRLGVEGTVLGANIMGRERNQGPSLDLFDKLGIAAWFTDEEGIVDDCNKTACKLLEKDKAEHLCWR